MLFITADRAKAIQGAARYDPLELLFLTTGYITLFFFFPKQLSVDDLPDSFIKMAEEIIRRSKAYEKDDLDDLRYLSSLFLL